MANTLSYRGGSLEIPNLPWGRLGLSICYDLRFPLLYQALVEAGVPAELVVVEGGGHSMDLFRLGAKPDLETLTAILLDFLQDCLNMIIFI